MLRRLTIAYLAAPHLLFAGGWLRTAYAVAAAIALLVAAVAAARRGPAARADVARAPGANRWLVLAVTVFVLVLSGVGAMAPQHGDWLKHNAVLHDLATRPWPVVYDAGPSMPEAGPLVYYIAYYLPAAAFGRLFGVLAAHAALAAWTFAGLLLCAAWVLRVAGNRSWWIWAMWFALSGMDVIGVLLTGEGNRPFMEWWAGLGQYSSNMSLLVCVPQHGIAGWLASGWILDDAERDGTVRSAGFCAALTALWSPFVTLGLAALLPALAARARWKTAWSIENIVGTAAILFPAVAFLVSIDAAQVPKGTVFHYGRLAAVRFWPAFCLLEFGVAAALAAPDLLRRPRVGDERHAWTRAWFCSAVAVLAIFPLFRVGVYNDLVMRASIPSLFLLWIVIVRLVTSSATAATGWRVQCLWLVLMVGSVQPITVMGLQATGTKHHLQFCQGSPNVSVADLPDEYRYQYLGRPEALFWSCLSRALPVHSGDGGEGRPASSAPKGESPAATLPTPSSKTRTNSRSATTGRPEP